MKRIVYGNSRNPMMAFKTEEPQGNWPSEFKYEFSDAHRAVRLSLNSVDKSLRKCDPWGLAYLCKKYGDTGAILFLSVCSGYLIPDVELLRRRLSFLAFNNPKLRIEIEIADHAVKPYSKQELFKRPATEIIHQEYGPRFGRDKPGRPEKDLQVWLFNEEWLNEGRNHRLAVLGEDFYQIKGRCLWHREFPTGVFREQVTEKRRILPTNYIDLVAFNKRKQLSIIELKLDSNPLELISQILDYALFARCYWKQLVQNIRRLFTTREQPLFPVGFEDEKRGFVAYMVNNTFHPKWRLIQHYYACDIKEHGFVLKQSQLGRTTTIGDPRISQ